MSWFAQGDEWYLLVGLVASAALWVLPKIVRGFRFFFERRKIEAPSDLSACTNADIAWLSYYNKIEPEVALAELHRIEGLAPDPDDPAWDDWFSRHTMVRTLAWFVLPRAKR